MESRICLLNAGPTGTETLKNLVLPGCGYVCVVDGGTVNEADCRNNFFVEASRIGSSRAQVALEFLLEMNPDVAGDAVTEDIEVVLARKPEFLKSFTLVIATQMDSAALAPIAACLWTAGIPLISARSYGLIGQVRVAVREHTIVESKPDSSTEDLRIARPWPALRAYTDGIDLDGADDRVHAHVPYVALLLKALDEWRSEVRGTRQVAGAEARQLEQPRTAAEKAAFKSVLWRLSRASDEVNFREAAEKAYVAYESTSVSPDTDVLLRDAAADALTPASPPFWFVVRALRDFRDSDHSLPLSGVLPDMTATTELYVSLQRVFSDKAAMDRAVVEARVAQLLSNVGAPASHVPQTLIALMCRNARHMAVLRTRSLEVEHSLDAPLPDSLMDELQTAQSDVMSSSTVAAGPTQAPVAWYFALRGADAFKRRHGRYPGQYTLNAPTVVAATSDESVSWE